MLEVDEPWATAGSDDVTPEVLLEYLCTPGMSRDPESLSKRYKEISIEPSRIFAVPAAPQIMGKLVWPLRHAKAAYMVGNYLGTIALTGIVAEMVPILVFDIRRDLDKFPPERQERLFGRPFEKLEQTRRVEVLRGLGWIDDEAVQAFGSIRSTRRRYMHLWSEEPDDVVAKAAVELFKDAVRLVVQSIGLAVTKDSHVTFSPHLLGYLERHGLKMERVGEPESSSDR